MARPNPRPVVVVGMLGTTLDAGGGPRRWERWRPTVAVCMHDDLVVARLELLHPPRWADLAAQVAADVRQVAPETEVRLHALPIDDPWDLEEVYGALHDFARAYPWAPEREDYLAHLTTGTHIAQISLFLLVESRRLPARLIQTSPLDSGALRPEPHRTSDRSASPEAGLVRSPVNERLASLGVGGGRAHRGKAGSWEVIDLDLARYDKVAARFAREHADATTLLKAGIATRSPGFNRLIDELERVAVGSRDPILLLGATGAGKSQLARRIYELKQVRRQVAGPLVEVNCATIRGDGAMSALFGHVKGAFTGAAAARAGFLRQADGGVLFLDEIGELGLDEQAMLLRALEDKRWPPVGADREVASDFQLLAGTNRDLPAMAAAGRFRTDLLARIDLWTFRLPGLAERREDLEPNLDHELERSSAALGARVTLAGEARARFLAFAASAEATWPGNFRDLGGAVRRMATLAPGGRITVAGVDLEIARLRAAWRALTPPAPTAGDGDDDLLAAVLGDRAADLDLVDRAQLAVVVRTCRAARSLSDAGRRLYAVSRTRKTSSNDADRLRKYLARFDLTWEQLTARPDP
ncbi:MAG TPA: RNA repair transcriptional activator RtcR [Kofleriaceae bacterium]|jgi:transcriptional regulatory protein RtcR|nr:RNA repair transcriptional activator RtcR [Kofleriaceae bacterium]